MSDAPAARTSLRTAWGAFTGRIDALPERDRRVLLVGVLSLLLAAELLLVQPIGARRAAIVAAATEQADETLAERERTEQARAEARNELDARAAKVERDLQRLGAEGPQGEPLALLLRRVLARHGVAVVALRDLDVIEVAADQPDTRAATEAPSDIAAAAAPGGEPPRTLFRHRLELTLGGDAAALIQAVDALDRQARPLRIERVRLVAVHASATQAVVTLTVLGTQRTWLAI